MKINIIAVELLQDHDRLIQFSCSIGVGIGFWNSGGSLTIGQEAEVELDIEGVMHLGTDIMFVDQQEAMIHVKNNQVNMIGRIEQVEEDSMITVRLGTGVILLEVEDKEQYQVNQWVQINTHRLVLTAFK